MRRIAAMLTGTLWCLTASAAHTQVVPGLPLSVEVRAGGAVPTGDFADKEPGVGAEAGPRVEAAAAVHLLPALAVYAGFSRSWFQCSECGARGLDDTVVDSGFELGVEGAVPLRGLGGVPWIRIGGVLNELAFSGFGSTLESDPGLGFRVGAGMSFSLVRFVRLTPGISYTAYSAELDLGGLPDRTVDVRHVAADLGLRYTF